MIPTDVVNYALTNISVSYIDNEEFTNATIGKQVLCTMSCTDQIKRKHLSSN